MDECLSSLFLRKTEKWRQIFVYSSRKYETKENNALNFEVHAQLAAANFEIHQIINKIDQLQIYFERPRIQNS